jgi:DnaJ-domain-containing protein 1
MPEVQVSSCSACGARLETPVACAACGAVHDVPESATPFEVLGLEPTHALDEHELRRRLTRFSRLVHPDFFGTADAATRERAGRSSARLNQAFDVLSDDARRADWLVVHLGGPAENQDRAMPQAFLAEVLEWNEVLEEAAATARSSSDVDPRVDALAVELTARRGAALQALRKLLEPLPERGSPRLTAARRELNVLRYLDRALGQIESLRLSRAERR